MRKERWEDGSFGALLCLLFCFAVAADSLLRSQKSCYSCYYVRLFWETGAKYAGHAVRLVLCSHGASKGGGWEPEKRGIWWKKETGVCLVRAGDLSDPFGFGEEQ